ncbi:serine-rich coiled-coil domain-containing protein 2-like isoform X1 [Conger conger]|uniref:serine-rich coiled-coil domain-containing protein 2-like isoform X1 n=1 Tax=Conger conger TaxID=82655 RepID=UPI002A5A287D|nr:serine-rich coiled-coil domain-containing protein 2-like isoform X1 [Conger conger]
MEEKALPKPTMVSRLPKFGTRPQGGTNPLPNGTGPPLHCQEGKGAGPVGKPNGMVRLAPPFSLKWKKGGGGPVPGLLSPTEGAELQKQGEEGRTGHRPQPQQQPTAPRELKKPSTITAKVRRSASAVTSSTTSRTIPQPSKPTPRGGSTQTSLTPGPHGNKLGLNGAAGRFGLGLQRTGSNPSAGGALRDGLSQSSDSLKAPSLDPENMVRSQSFTHFKQVPSPTGQPIARSFSFTRAAERAKSLLGKPSPTQARGGAIQYGKGPGARPSGGPTVTTSPKKSLLPSCVPSKPPALAYRLTRPSLGRQPRPLLPGKGSSDQEPRAGAGDSLETSPTTPDPPSEVEDALDPESSPAELVMICDPEPSSCYLGEVLEDMSLSSTSSLERNDMSEEYLDDFDNLGVGGGMLLFPAHDGELHQSQPDDNAPVDSPPDTPNRTRHCSFLTDGVDWAAMGLTGMKEDPCCRGNQAGSPDVDFAHGSSLDLSPSDSSGGTYMWDEEGLEPLGTIARPCGSYDSELNSLDILNNLDNLESCDLEDDDLMLDVDLPEDGSLHSDADGMSHFERADRGARQGWRRRQHRWSGSDHFHNDNSLSLSLSPRSTGFQQFEGLLSPGAGRGGARQQQAVVWADGHTVALDEVTLGHMTEDCSSVKTQLLKLRMLLQVEDGGTIQDALDSGILSPEPREDVGTSLQVEELLREVEELREELRSKDKTISQMTQQVAVLSAHAASCQCQQRRPESRGERRTNHDKATQTPWRAHGPPVLQPCRLSERLPQERLARTPSSADPSDAGPDGQPGARPRPCLDASAGPAPGSRLRPPAGESAASMRAPEPPAPPADPAHARAEGDRDGGRPRILQSLRLHRKVSVPTLTQEGPARPSAGPVALLKKRQLPPPTRGLPCFSSGPQASGPARGPTLFGLPRPPGTALPKAGGLASPNHSRLPKPKIH